MTAKIKLNSASGGGSFSLQAPSSSSNTRVMTLPDTADGTILTTTNPKSGNILQIKNTLKTDQFSTNSTSFVDVTGLSIDITATSSSNKFYISCVVFANCQDSAFLRLVKDGTVIAAGTTSSETTLSPALFQGFGYVRNNSTSSGAAYGIAFLDTPGDTSSHTYKVQGLSENGSSHNLKVNGRAMDNTMSLSSSITAMEVAA